MKGRGEEDGDRRCAGSSRVERNSSGRERDSAQKPKAGRRSRLPRVIIVAG